MTSRWGYQKNWLGPKEPLKKKKKEPDLLDKAIPEDGWTYAIDGATGERVRASWPKCGHTCRECWPCG